MKNPLSFLALLTLSLALCLTQTGCVGGYYATGPGPVYRSPGYVNSWGGSYTAAQDAAYFKPFTAASGIQIRVVTPVSYGKIKAQVQTRRYEFDMTSINSMQWLRATREGGTPTSLSRARSCPRATTQSQQLIRDGEVAISQIEERFNHWLAS